MTLDISTHHKPDLLRALMIMETAGWAASYGLYRKVIMDPDNLHLLVRVDKPGTFRMG